MKKIKMKETILSHYQKVHELEMNGYTVRVFKPKTMQRLPSYMMLDCIQHKAKDAICYMITADKADWRMGNPDYGMWDALTVYHCDPSHKTFNIYIAAILVRPYSCEAYDTYCRMHESISDVNQRLMLIWDSREFDRIHGYSLSYGAYNGQDNADENLYQVKDKDRDIADLSPSYYLEVIDGDEDDNPVHRRCVKFRFTDREVIYSAIMGRDEAERDGGTELMHVCAKAFTDFRKKHPEVTEMHFYTDELVESNQEEGE